LKIFLFVGGGIASLYSPPFEGGVGGGWSMTVSNMGLLRKLAMTIQDMGLLRASPWRFHTVIASLPVGRQVERSEAKQSYVKWKWDCFTPFAMTT